MGTHGVGIDDIVTLVNIALGSAPASLCAEGIPAGDTVNVTLIVREMLNALQGCPAW